MEKKEKEEKRRKIRKKDRERRKEERKVLKKLQFFREKNLVENEKFLEWKMKRKGRELSFSLPFFYPGENENRERRKREKRKKRERVLKVKKSYLSLFDSTRDLTGSEESSLLLITLQSFFLPSPPLSLISIFFIFLSSLKRKRDREIEKMHLQKMQIFLSSNIFHSFLQLFHFS